MTYEPTINLTATSNSITRRALFKSTATTSLAALLPESNGSASATVPLSIVIIGAGMAGLCAAYELEKRGHNVTILEADTAQVGGRVRTMRFVDGQYGELGAMRIPGNHHLTRQYITKFGLSLRPFVQYNPEAYYYAHGIRKRIREVAHMSREYTLGMDGRATSEWSQPFDEIVGGMDTLAAAFAARLKSKPRMGCAVTHIVQDVANRRVSAAYSETLKHSPTGANNNRSNKTMVYGDYLICTLPVPVLRRLKIEPALPASKQRAMAELPYNAANKVLALTEHRFWETDDHIFGGGTYTDLPTEFAYYSSDNAKARDPRISAGPGVLLASYSIGQRALKYASLSPEPAAESALHDLAKVHPQLLKSGMVRQKVSWSWDNHPWSRGGFAAPHKRMELNAILASPEGRIFFAGEHISQHRTWIQGAFESALVAVKEILATERATVT